MKKAIHVSLLITLFVCLSLSLFGCGWFDYINNTTEYDLDLKNLPVSEGLEYTLNEDEKSYTVSGIGTFPE